MNIHEYQAKAVLRDFGVPVAVRLPRPEDIYAGKIAEE